VNKLINKLDKKEKRRLPTMSNKEDVESAAQRVLNRCARIEESKRKIEESIESSSSLDENISSIEYREQLDQIRRALVTTQVNAQLKRDELEEEVELLRNQVSSMKEERETHQKAEEGSVIERDEIRAKLSNAVSWIEKARSYADEMKADNDRLKKIVFALGGQVVSSRNLLASSRNLLVNTTDKKKDETFEDEDEVTPRSFFSRRELSRSAAGESPMEDNKSHDNSEKLTRPSLREWGGRMLSSRRLVDSN